jgi:hypothetical protein
MRLWALATTILWAWSPGLAVVLTAWPSRSIRPAA